MRHVPIAEFKDKMSEVIAAAEAGDDIMITRHGRDAVRLIGAERDRLSRQRAALEAICDYRQQLRGEGVRVSPEELIEWRDEGRK